MKTYHFHPFHRIGHSRLFLLTILFWMAGTMSVQAADDVDYGFWVGSVKVKKSNCNNITGGNIISGTVKYNPDTNVLTLTNVRIKGTGSGGDCIHNKSRPDLTVEFYGNNYLSARDDYAIWCETSTHFWVCSGTTTIEGYKDGKSTVFLDKELGYSFGTKDNASLTIWSTRSYAIEGGGLSVLFLYGGNIKLTGGSSSKSRLANIDTVYILKENGVCDVTLVATDNSDYPVVTNVHSMYGISYSTAPIDHPVIISPNKAEYNSSKKTICDSYGSTVYASDVVISSDFVAVVNSNYFPDDNFRSYIENKLDAVVLKQSHINSCTKMDVSFKDIASLKGIDYFSELTELNCQFNNLRSLDLGSSKKKLTRLQCDNNHLTQLDVSELESLKTLICDYNDLTQLKGYLWPIQYLSCSNNNLSTLDLSKNNGLTYLDCSNNSLKNIGSLDSQSQRSRLETFDCSGNEFTTLSLSNFSKLTEFICYNNPSLYTLNCSNCSSLEVLSLYLLPKLETLYCSNNALWQITLNCSNLETLDVSNNSLESIDLSNCPAVMTFNCANNLFTSLNLSKMTNLYTLDCSNSSLDFLDMYSNGVLETLYCQNNNLTGMYLKNCRRLKILNCSNNQLTSFNLPQSTELQNVTCYLNNLKGSEMDAIVAALPNRMNADVAGEFNAVYTGINFMEGNVCTTQNVSDAWTKNWKTYQYDGNNYSLYASVPTDIRTAEADMDDDAPRYNLSGQRVGRDYKGVVIVNGRKVVK